MARATRKQQEQRELAWLAFQVAGAIGNLGKSIYGSSLPDQLHSRIRRVHGELCELQTMIRNENAARKRDNEHTPSSTISSDKA
jgi:phytoene/squalene synthetase